MGNKKSKTQVTTTIGSTNHKNYNLIKDHFTSYNDLQSALRKVGLESSNLIVGIDFTKSNTWNGGLPYYPNTNLHSLAPVPNLYQHVITILGKTLEVFDNDKLIPTYGFGDSVTEDRAVFPLMTDQTGNEIPCYTFTNVLASYNTIINQFALGTRSMSGPTTFAPLIRQAIHIVKQLKTYHILLIICDGEINNKEETVQAIVEASKYPLSIICIGVGKGPWDLMEEFDDEIPERDFDNFQFVEFHKVMEQCENVEVEFAKHAMMEIPEQYEYIKNNLLRK